MWGELDGRLLLGQLLELCLPSHLHGHSAGPFSRPTAVQLRAAEELGQMQRELDGGLLPPDLLQLQRGPGDAVNPFNALGDMHGRGA
jgi:hypothetical protein